MVLIIKVIKGIDKKYIDSLIALHCDSFSEDYIDACYDFNFALKLDECYLLLNESNDEIVSFVGISEKTAYVSHKKIKIALIGCIMTAKKYQRQGYAKKLLKLASDDYLKSYDSVIIQAWNWDIYKSFDLVDTTIKYQYKFNDNITSLINFDKFITKPSAYLINKINRYKNSYLVNINESWKAIKQKMNLCKQHKLNFIAYKTAYIWYDDNREIDHFFYHNINDLLKLFYFIKPTNPLLLFDKKIDNNILINMNSKLIITKTFKESKMIINNINLTDFIM